MEHWRILENDWTEILCNICIILSSLVEHAKCGTKCGIAGVVTIMVFCILLVFGSLVMEPQKNH